jgi:sorbitol/mannitol transport system substrate-binding protein
MVNNTGPQKTGSSRLHEDGDTDPYQRGNMKPPPTVARTFRVFGVILALGLTAAACSKSTAKDTTAATSAESAAPADSAAPAADTTAAPAADSAAPAAETTAAPSAAETTAAAAPTAAGGEITVAIVDNPTMKDIQTLTPDNFTKTTGIKVNYVSLNEQTLREQVTKSVGSGAGQYDVVMIGPYEAPQFGANGWLQDLTKMATDDKAYDVGDIIPAVKGALSNDGKMYAVPFYAESSFVMYRKDLADAAGAKIPDAPTWDEIAAAAKKMKTADTAGICLRGKPGWGDLGASLGTVVNTFGGTWWEANADGSIGKAQVNTGGFKEAFNFYTQLLKDAGEPDAANASFNECLTMMKDSKAAMWYDATVAAGILESADSPIKGKLAYALAPTKVTKASGWLWSWALAMPAGTAKADLAWKYMSWATSKEYIKLSATLPGGWAGIPPGSRTSTYSIPEYLAAAPAFAPRTLAAMNAAPINDPGTTKRPGLPGVQYVGVPEFADIGTRCTAELSAAIAGNQTNDAALDKCQAIASEATK